MSRVPARRLGPVAALLAGQKDWHEARRKKRDT